MAVDNKNIIDSISIDKNTKQVKLTITDHLPWTNDAKEHVAILQEKINQYLTFIESGEIYRAYDLAIGKKIIISVVGKYKLSKLAEKFYVYSKECIIEAGFDLEFIEL